VKKVIAEPTSPSSGINDYVPTLNCSFDDTTALKINEHLARLFGMFSNRFHTKADVDVMFEGG